MAIQYQGNLAAIGESSRGMAHKKSHGLGKKLPAGERTTAKEQSCALAVGLRLDGRAEARGERGQDGKNLP